MNRFLIKYIGVAGYFQLAANVANCESQNNIASCVQSTYPTALLREKQ